MLDMCYNGGIDNRESFKYKVVKHSRLAVVRYWAICFFISPSVALQKITALQLYRKRLSCESRFHLRLESKFVKNFAPHEAVEK